MHTKTKTPNQGHNTAHSHYTAEQQQTFGCATSDISFYTVIVTQNSFFNVSLNRQKK